MEVSEVRRKRGEFIGMISQLVNELYELSMNDSLVKQNEEESEEDFRTRLFDQQETFSARADKLKRYLDLLFYQDFKNRTAEFEQAYAELKPVHAGIQTELNNLDKLVEKMKQINQFLKLVDQAIVIAAGLAKSV